MRLREYQQNAVNGCIATLQQKNSAVIVLPTGCGKTIVFSEAIRLASKRCMVIAHREELIRQAAKKIESMTGEPPAIEMAEEKSFEPFIGMKSKVVVASVQTLNAKNYLGKRFLRFDPSEFSLLVIDECHHAIASSYRSVVNHFQKNTKCKLLGVTATPDRSDNKALGQVFEEVAYQYQIKDAINAGWLVPIKQTIVRVESLDFSRVNKVAGDLNQRQLAEVMEYEKNLHGVVTPTLEIAGDRKTIVFASSVAHADRISEILNRHKPGCARMISGKTPKDMRAAAVADFAKANFQFLVNVGITVEGFDDPGVSVIVMARPTSSRSLYAQMVGRGTRPEYEAIAHLPLHDESQAMQDRREAILGSSKPHCEVVDFVGNAGKHELIYAADILGGDYSEAAVQRVKEQTEQEESTPMDVIEMLEAAEREEEVIQAELAQKKKRDSIKAEVSYKALDHNPFDVLQIAAPTRIYAGAPPLTHGQQQLLERNSIDTNKIDNHTQRLLFKEIINRKKEGKCTYKQAKLLRKHGYDGQQTFEQAGKLIDQIAANNWRRP